MRSLHLAVDTSACAGLIVYSDSLVLRCSLSYWLECCGIAMGMCGDPVFFV